VEQWLREGVVAEFYALGWRELLNLSTGARATARARRRDPRVHPRLVGRQNCGRTAPVCVRAG
jgi:hypothetical protein